MRTGYKSGFWVVEWSDDLDQSLWKFVSQFPEVVLGKRVAITSFDSGPLVPSQDEYANGWEKRGDVAISPVVESIEDVPSAGFDEWYVYSSEVSNAPTQSFVNYSGFAPLDEASAQVDDFWTQVVNCQPLHIIGEGDPTMFFATRDQAVFEKVCSSTEMSTADRVTAMTRQ